MNKTKILSITLLTSLLSLGVSADEKLENALDQAMKSELRTEADTDRDKNRLPKQTLAFFGLKTDMKVIELLPGSGWYTKLLAPTLAEKGEFSVAIGTGRVKKALVGQPGMEKINIIEAETNIRREEGARFYTVDKFDLGQKDVDMIFTFRNYHNFDQKGRMRINDAAFKALKSGGVYAVVDHTRRHMQELDNENGRRVDPVLAIKEIQAAGFKLVDYSDLHYRADDELRFEVGRKSVTGNTDRFTLKFVKP
jgi:predicted methyltransferase